MVYFKRAEFWHRAGMARRASLEFICVIGHYGSLADEPLSILQLEMGQPPYSIATQYSP